MVSEYSAYNTKVGVAQSGDTLFVKSGGRIHAEPGSRISPYEGMGLYFPADYQAYGDGIQDDTDALNNLMEDAAENAGGVAYLDPRCTYLVGSQTHLIPQNNIRFVGGGTIKLADSSAIATSRAIFYGDSVENFILDGIAIDGNRDQNTDITSVMFLGTSRNCHVRHCDFLRSSNSAVYFRGGEVFSAHDNFSEDSRATDMRVGFDVSKVTVAKNHLICTGDYVQHDDGFIAVRWDGPDQISIIDNILEAPAGSGASFGIWVTNGNNVLVRGNQIKIPDGSGIFLNYSQGLEAGTSTTSNDISTGEKTFTTQAGESWVAGNPIIVFQTSSSGNFLYGTVTSYSGTTLVAEITSTGGSGTGITAWTLQRALNLTNHIITQNIIECEGGIISLDTNHHANINGLQVTDNSVICGASQGIAVKEINANTTFSNVVVGNNVVNGTPDNSADKGILVGTATVSNNTVDLQYNGSNSTDGIDCYGVGSVIVGNRVNLHGAASGRGIITRANQALITGNRVTGTSGNGIRCDTGTDYNVVSNNILASTGVISVAGASSKVDGSNVSL